MRIHNFFPSIIQINHIIVMLIKGVHGLISFPLILCFSVLCFGNDFWGWSGDWRKASVSDVSHLNAFICYILWVQRIKHSTLLCLFHPPTNTKELIADPQFTIINKIAWNCIASYCFERRHAEISSLPFHSIIIQFDWTDVHVQVHAMKQCSVVDGWLIRTI